MNIVYHLPGLLPPSLPRILVPVPSADHIPLLLLIGCLIMCVYLNWRKLLTAHWYHWEESLQQLWRNTDWPPGPQWHPFPFQHQPCGLPEDEYGPEELFKKLGLTYHLSSQLFQPSSSRMILIVTLLTRVSILILVSPPTVVVANIPVATDSWRWRGCEAESYSLRWTMSTIVTDPPHAGKRGDELTLKRVHFLPVVMVPVVIANMHLPGTRRASYPSMYLNEGQTSLMPRPHLRFFTPTCQRGLFSWWMTTVHWCRRAQATIASFPPNVPCSDRLERWSSKLMSSSTKGSKSSLKTKKLLTGCLSEITTHLCFLMYLTTASLWPRCSCTWPSSWSPRARNRQLPSPFHVYLEI